MKNKLFGAVSVLILAFVAAGCSSTTTGAKAITNASVTTASVAPTTTQSAPKTDASAQVMWCKLTIGEPKSQVLAQMGVPNGNKVNMVGFDYAEWDVGNDILVATFTNGLATNLQAYSGAVGPDGATDISCQAFRNNGGQ